MTTPHLNPMDIAGRGQKIYERKFEENFTKNNSGQFAAIEIISEEAFVAAQPEEALRTAQKQIPGGMFHLVKIGSAGAYRVSYTYHARGDRLLHRKQPSY
jgi:hypothetical protein